MLRVSVLYTLNMQKKLSADCAGYGPSPFACHTYRRFMYILEMSFIDYPCGVCKKEVCVDD